MKQHWVVIKSTGNLLNGYRVSVKPVRGQTLLLSKHGEPDRFFAVDYRKGNRLYNSNNFIEVLKEKVT